MAHTGQPSRERVASSQRALAILDLLAAEGPLGTNEIARRLGTTASTVSRQLGTLVASRYAGPELPRGRRAGSADTYEDRGPGLNAIAAPIFGSDESLAGIVALQGPLPRFGRAPARTALPVLLDRAGAISEALGSTSAATTTR